MATITSANAAYLLAVAGIFPAATALQGFGVDDAFETEAVDAAVTQLGVDGTGVAGWVPREYPQSITLLASSPSNDLFDTWASQQDAVSDVIYATGIIRIPATGKQYAMAQGVLQRYLPIPPAKRVLGPRVFRIVWQP